MAKDHGPSDAQKLQRAITRANNARLPLEGDFHYFNSFKNFKEPVKECLKSIAAMLQKMSGAGPDLPEALQDKDEAFEAVTALLDDTLEQADAALEKAKKELTESDKAASSHAAEVLEASTVAGEPASSAKRHKPSAKSGKNFFAQQSGNTDRPQDRFEDAVDNSNTPFVHNFEHVLKYQGLDSVAEQQLHESKVDAHARRLSEGSAGNPPPIPHPLAGLLADLHYVPWQLEGTSPCPPKALEETPLTFVDTFPAVQAMVQHLAAVKEVAVDLEHHQYRSFAGFTCLLQLSTRDEDFIVDPLALRAHLGAALTPIFSNPEVVKVLHGADKDIEWLQRDFGIYVASIFDTGQASRVLEYPGHGLGYLLQHFCDVKTDKRFQLADWRVRPLSEEMMLYARMDTHYLLYIYDRMKAELINQGSTVPPALDVPTPPGTPPGALGVTLERSKQLCLHMYEKDLFTETSYQSLTRHLVCSSEQLAVFAGLYAWRDKLARAEDESTGYVLSRSLMQKLAMQMPTTASQVRGFCNNRSAPLAFKNAAEVAQVIAISKQQALLFDKPAADRTPRSRVQSPHKAAKGLSRSPMAQQPELSSSQAITENQTTEPGVEASTQAQPALTPGLGVATAPPAAAQAAPAAAAGQLPADHDNSVAELTESAAKAAELTVENSPADVHKASTEEEARSVASPVSGPHTIKPRALKSIMLARGSSAFSAQPRRPALASGSAVTQSTLAAAAVSHLAAAQAPAAVSQQPTESADELPAVSIEVIKQQPDAVAVREAAAAAAQAPSVAAESTAAVPVGLANQNPIAMGSAFARQSRVIPQIRAAGTGAFGSSAPRAVASVPGQSHAGDQSIALGKSDLPDLAAVSRLKAQFTLPFATAPAEGQNAAAKAGKRQRPEGQEAVAGQSPDDMAAAVGPSASSATGVRAVVDALQAGNAPEADAGIQPAKKKQKGSGEEAWQNQDFLPLPMSESYRLPSRRNRSKPEDPEHRQNMLSHDKPGRWSHDKHDPTGSRADPDGSGADRGLRGSSARVQRALVSTGLDSSSGSDANEEEEQQMLHQQKKKRQRASDAAQEEELSGSQHELNSAKKRNSKRRPTLADPSEEEAQHLQQQQEKKMQSRGSHGSDTREQQSPGLNPFDALVRGKQREHLQEDLGQETESADRTQQGGVPSNSAAASGSGAPALGLTETPSGLSGTARQPFDYAAARAQAPGLELGLSAAAPGVGSRGRGRGRGGRDSRGGGRGRGAHKEDPKPTPAGAFDPYGTSNEPWLKAGSRSAVNPRSGNRNQSFAN